ncbi:hypothetical protein Hanom_Chr13g01190651 [Helianthus anomalus]
MNLHPELTSLSFYAANFEELAPPSAESEERINAIYRLSESERSFRFTIRVQVSIPHPTCLVRILTSYVPAYIRLVTILGYSEIENFPLCVDPAKMPEVFDLEELDTYSGPVQIKKEPTAKPSTATKPSASSKPSVMPKPSPATKPRASSSRKRKKTDSPTTSTKTFPYEKHGFLESSGFMISFLNQFIILILYPTHERLTNLYEEACGTIKMLDVKLKKDEITIVDQGKIVATKSQHYEDKFKAVTQEAQVAVKKATQDAQIKPDAAQTQHEQDRISYREDLTSSVVISLLQTMLKMSYQAKAVGFECPTWNIEAWEAKLKDLGGNPVEYHAKPEFGTSSKAAEVAAEVEGKTGEDPGADVEASAGGDGEAMVGDAAAP